MTSVREVKNHLKHYVLHVLYVHQKPNTLDRAYFPTTNDVKNHVYLAQCACQLSKFDQENLRLKIEQWKQDNPTAQFLYRPLINSEETSSSSKQQQAAAAAAAAASSSSSKQQQLAAAASSSS